MNNTPQKGRPQFDDVKFGIEKKNGWGADNVREPTVVRLEYKMTWKKAKIDLRELAKLRESG